jgi:hypothetical protein
MTTPRSVVILRYKKPFIQWVNSYTGDGREYSSEYFEENRTAVVIPKRNSENEARAYLDTIWSKLFEEVLADWNNLEILWPRNRTPEMFHKWFSVEFQPNSISVANELIKK